MGLLYFILYFLCARSNIARRYQKDYSDAVTTPAETRNFKIF